jgi:hypothetical protein
MGFLSKPLEVRQLWQRAKQDPLQQCCNFTEQEAWDARSTPQVGIRYAGPPLPSDPGIHDYDLGERVTVVSSPDVYVDVNNSQDQLLHLVQDEETISELLYCAIPPDEYYEALAVLWRKWWPTADPKVLEHMMSVCIAFDTATTFAMSFGIAKFSLCQVEAKLVGEIVGKHGEIFESSYCQSY